ELKYAFVATLLERKKAYFHLKHKYVILAQNRDKLLIKFDTHVEAAKESKHEIAANAYKLRYLDCRTRAFPCCPIEDEDAELLYLDVPLLKMVEVEQSEAVVDTSDHNLSSMEVRETQLHARGQASVEGITSSAPRPANHVGAFPVKLHLLQPLPWCCDESFSEHKVYRLKLSDLGLFVVVRRQLLLISCNSNNGLLSFFFKQIKVEFKMLPVLVKTTHFNAYGRNCDVWGDDCL
ncbi:unnamed protein product, partial [Prunus brigantina]